MLPPHLHPHFIKFEKPKNELYLTFSAVVNDNEKNKILKIQNNIERIIKKEEMLKDLGFGCSREGLYKRIERGDRFIYKYPPESLHFSIVNFATYDIRDLIRFKEARSIIENTDNFRKLKTETINFMNNFQSKCLERNEFEVDIRRIYLPAGIEKSLALNAFPPQNCFFKTLENMIETTRKELDTTYLPLSHNLEIKAYPEKNYQYFALNIFRFIDRDEFVFNQRGNFYRQINKINRKFKKFTIKLKPCLVISDPYLANDKPQIDC